MAEKICENQAVYRFTWPGNNESFICEAHAIWIRRVVKAMGMHLQLIPLEEDADKQCRQKTGGDG